MTTGPHKARAKERRRARAREKERVKGRRVKGKVKRARAPSLTTKISSRKAKGRKAQRARQAKKVEKATVEEKGAAREREKAKAKERARSELANQLCQKHNHEPRLFFGLRALCARAELLEAQFCDLFICCFGLVCLPVPPCWTVEISLHVSV